MLATVVLIFVFFVLFCVLVITASLVSFLYSRNYAYSSLQSKVLLLAFSVGLAGLVDMKYWYVLQHGRTLKQRERNQKQNYGLSHEWWYMSLHL